MIHSNQVRILTMTNSNQVRTVGMIRTTPGTREPGQQIGLVGPDGPPRIFIERARGTNPDAVPLRGQGDAPSRQVGEQVSSGHSITSST
jgi:hypothetical protein